MNQQQIEKKAKEIISKCDALDILSDDIKKYSAFVKAEAVALLGGVGTASVKQNKSNSKKTELQAYAKARFRK